MPSLQLWQSTLGINDVERDALLEHSEAGGMEELSDQEDLTAEAIEIRVSREKERERERCMLEIADVS